MLSSGTTALSTSGNDPIDLIANTGDTYVSEVTVVNEGDVAGFVSVDGGTTWARLPAGPSSRTFKMASGVARVQAKRTPDGSDMTGLYADAF